MRIEQLIYFVAAVRYKSFNKAANELYISQPSIGKAISTLEEELGCQLMVRTNRGIKLTKAGYLVYDDARTILSTIDSWKSLAESSNYDETVAIVATSTMCSFMTNDFLLGMKDKYPKMRVVLQEGRVRRITDMMISENINIGILPVLDDILEETDSLFAAAAQNNWTIDFLLEDEKKVFISSDSGLFKKERVTLEDLKKVPLATYSNIDDEHAILYGRYFDEAQRYCLYNKENIFRMVAKNRCATIFPVITSRYEYLIENKYVRPVDVEGLHLSSSKFMMVHRTGKALNESERLMIKEIKRYFENFR